MIAHVITIIVLMLTNIQIITATMLIMITIVFDTTIIITRIISIFNMVGIEFNDTNIQMLINVVDTMITKITINIITATTMVITTRMMMMKMYIVTDSYDDEYDYDDYDY